MKCGTCGGAVATVTGGRGSPRYGCVRSWRDGIDRCANRLTVRAKVADADLLARLQAELLEPATMKYLTDTLVAASIFAWMHARSCSKRLGPRETWPVSASSGS